MRNDRQHLGRARLNEMLSGQANCPARVGHVVDEDGNLARDGADQDHPGLLPQPKRKRKDRFGQGS